MSQTRPDLAQPSRAGTARPAVARLRRALAGVSIGLFALALGAVPSPAGAQDATRVHTMVGANDDIAPPPVSGDALRLSLSEAIEIALEQNLDLVIQRYDRTQSALRVMQNQGIYDLFLSGGVSFSDSNSPNSNQLEGAAVVSQEDRSYRLGLSQLFATGGTGSFTISANRAGTNSTNAFINPQYTARDGISFVQPLLRNFGRLSTAARGSAKWSQGPAFCAVPSAGS